MSEPKHSVTPQNNTPATPVLPPCSMPYRWQLHVGHYVAAYLDHAQPKAAWERHTHPTVQILVCGPGAECTIHWEIDNTHHHLELHGEHAWVIGAEVPHWLEWHREALALVFYVKTEYAEEAAGGVIAGSALFNLQQIAKCDPKIPHFLSDFDGIKQSDTDSERLHLDSLASLVAYRLFRVWDCLLRGAANREPTLEDAVLRRLDKFIAERLETKLVLADMARAVGMGSSNLCRLFKRRMGVSLGQYLIGRRIERAKELLQAEDYRIGEIALAVGFSNQGHFDAFFKKWVGVTPSDYRIFIRQSQGVPKSCGE